jgi:hypothetical protein
MGIFFMNFMNQVIESNQLEIKNTIISKKIIQLFGFECHLLESISLFRAIRTRTVDLLGKRVRTYYYQNDSNSFKDPTCIFFLHWALSLTDRKIS